MEIGDLVRMANEIADFFCGYPHAEAVAGTAGHLRNFWDPRMRRELCEHAAAGGKGLNPIALEAAAALFPCAAPTAAG
jgi:formate dehydrogenase subunit delta